MGDNNLSVMTQKSLSWSLATFEKINDVIKGIGIIGGGIFASIADWVFGSVTFSVLFSNYGFKDGLLAWLIGLCISMGAWGVQLILWQVLMSGKYSRMNGSWPQKLVFGAVILMKFADDMTDIMAVFWMLKDNPFQGHLHPSLYVTFIGVVYFLVWVLVGFSELFVSMSISLLKPGGQQTYQNHGKQKSNYQPKPQVKYDPNILSRFPQRSYEDDDA